MGIIPPSVELLKQKLSPVLVHASIGLLKNLLLGGGTCCCLFRSSKFSAPFIEEFLSCNGPALLPPLVELEDSDHVRYEAARLVCQLCKEGPIPGRFHLPDE